MTRALLILLGLAAGRPAFATVRSDAGASLAAEMEAPARQSLLAKCGRDPRCALYAAPGERSERPAILVEKMSCRETRRARLRYRRCGFALKSPARTQRLTCSVEFHEVPGDDAFPWSDRRLVKPRREYLPTSGLMAPLILGNSTLACSGSLADYAG